MPPARLRRGGPHNLRDRLTEREIDAYRHPLVRFVELDTYEAAGGGIRRDLFAEGDAGVYLTDAALLERLAQDKLAGIAATVRAEGWAWVDATPGMTHADLHAFQRAPRERREPNKREAQRIEKLQAKMLYLATVIDRILGLPEGSIELVDRNTLEALACALDLTNSPLNPCCKACASRSTTSPVAPWWTTSSTPSP